MRLRGGTFFRKVLGGTIALILATALVSYATAVAKLDQHYEVQTRERVARETHLVQALAELSWDSESRRFETGRLSARARELDDSRLTLIAADGTVLFDTHEDHRGMDNHANRVEVLHPGEAVTRYSRTLEREMTYFALPVVVDGATRAFARVAISSQARDARVEELRAAFRTGVLIATLLSVAFAAVFAGRISRPLTEISELVSEVGKGGTPRRIEVRSRDEVGELGTAVNQMADALADQIARIERDKSERESILSAITEGLLALDEDQRVLFINEPALTMLGIEGEDPTGRHVSEICRNSELLRLIEECGKQAGPLHSEAHLATEGGQLVVEMSAARLGGEREGTGGLVVVLRDITELRRLEAVRRDFVSNVSHELKTPLTAMRGYVEAVLDDPRMEEEQRLNFLRKARVNTERLSAIVSDLLSLSRLESEGKELNFERLELGRLAREAIHVAADLAESRRIRLHLECAVPEVHVSGDGQALGMALSNLISNAIQYSPEGEEVLVAVGLEGTRARVEVRDHGPGISPADQERIFERFYRIDKARSRRLGGTGLGLAIVRHVMASHGGAVEIESEVGRGSCFRLLMDALDVLP